MRNEAAGHKRTRRRSSEMLKLYNTLTATKEVFVPLTPGKVRMYVCGVTVYDDCHLGHARSAIVFDVIRRYLIHGGLQVTYVKNFTDIDDKILARASHEDVPWTEIVQRYLAAYERDMTRLGVRPADVEPKATEHLAEILTMIQGLVVKGYAYQVDGDVYYDVKSFPGYGQLSHRNLEEMQAGARVEVDERKHHPMDFVLWKAAKSGEPAWPSPWGEGRPGWHIECSAMSVRHLGETFDIHGGGQDLIFPHHENEIAQSCAYSGKEFARVWLHNGFVTVDQEKMSKSLGNFFTIREIFDRSGCSDQVTAETLRYFLLSTHYRNAVDFSDVSLRQAKAALDHLYDLLQRLEEEVEGGLDSEGEEAARRTAKALREAFQHAMDDDVNTPKVLAELQRFRSDLNTRLKSGLSHAARQESVAAIRAVGEVLGICQLPVKTWEYRELRFYAQDEPETAWVLTEEEIERRIAERQEARRQRDFARADAIRSDLAAHGVTIEDRPDGSTRWKR